MDFITGRGQWPKNGSTNRARFEANQIRMKEFETMTNLAATYITAW